MKTAFQIIKSELELPKEIKLSESDSTRIGEKGLLLSDVINLMEKYAEQWKPKAKSRKKICYCGSLRFIEQFKEAEYQSVIDGNIALLPCCMFVDIERKHGAESDYKQKADELHKRKIDICDEVFVLNVGGYIGQSTRSEIDYALKIGKPIKYLETPDESATNATRLTNETSTHP